MWAFSFRKSVASTWLITYILVLVLPVIILAGSMFRFLRTLDNEINYSSSIVLEQIQLKMDAVIDSFNTISTDIIIDPGIRRIMGIKSRNEMAAYDMYRTVMSLNRLIAAKNQTGDLYVYFSGCDLVMNHRIYQQSQDYYDIHLKNSGFSKELWTQIISGRYNSAQYYRLQYNETNEPVDRIVMVKPIMLEGYSDLYANIVLFMDDTSFMQQDFASLKRETILILDSHDQILYNSSGFPIEHGVLSYSELEEPVNMQISGRDVIVSQISSKSANWKYIIIVEKSSYQAQLDQIKHQIFLSVILCLVVGGIFIMYGLTRSYRPLRGILHSLQRNLPQYKNEYQIIEHAIGEMQHEVSSIKDILDRQRIIMHEQVILGLLEADNYIAESSGHVFSQYDISFQSQKFYVLLYHIRLGDGPFVSDNSMLSEPEQMGLSQLILQNIMSELFADKGITVYPFRKNRRLGFLLNPTDEMDTAAVIKSCLEAAADVLDEYFQIDYLCACSDLCKSREELSFAYSQALEVLEYKRTLDIEDFIFYNDIEGMNNRRSLIYPPGFEIKLINAMRIGDSQSACESIRAVVHENREHRCPPEFMRYLMVTIAGMVIRAVSEFDEKISFDISELSFSTVMQGGSIKEMCLEIEQEVIAVCAIVQSHMNDESSQQGREIHEQCKQYIMRNYTDESLSVSKIADEMAIHIVTLSRVFKDNEGESLSSYINNLRVEKAKDLIISDLKLEQVASSVGFGSLRTFMRSFKKHEGVTPGQYKSKQPKM